MIAKLIPVSEKHRAASIADQITKAAVELNEVREAHSKYELMSCQMNTSREEVDKLHKEIAIEAGDEIIACVTLIDMLGYSVEEILDAVYKKNAARGYYE